MTPAPKANKTRTKRDKKASTIASRKKDQERGYLETTLVDRAKEKTMQKLTDKQKLADQVVCNSALFGQHFKIKFIY